MKQQPIVDHNESATFPAHILTAICILVASPCSQGPLPPSPLTAPHPSPSTDHIPLIPLMAFPLSSLTPAFIDLKTRVVELSNDLTITFECGKKIDFCKQFFQLCHNVCLFPRHFSLVLFLYSLLYADHLLLPSLFKVYMHRLGMALSKQPTLHIVDSYLHFF